MTSPWLNFAVALGIGLLIGLERERSEGPGAHPPAGGFTLRIAPTIVLSMAAGWIAAKTLIFA